MAVGGTSLAGGPGSGADTTPDAVAVVVVVAAAAVWNDRSAVPGLLPRKACLAAG